MDLPRFGITQLSPALGFTDPGDAFQIFCHQVLQEKYPDLIRFKTSGKDGAIDSSATGTTRTVCESKYSASDELENTKARWKEVAKRLLENLADPQGPPKGQSQYAPWYRMDVPIQRFIFCVSADLNPNGCDVLKADVTGFFRDLAGARSHLAHLKSLEVEVLAWPHLRTLLEKQPRLIFRWFHRLRPRGLIPLDERQVTSPFGAFLDGSTLPYYSRADHARTNPVPRGSTVPNEEELLRSLETGRVTSLILSGRGGVGKTRLMLELGRRALAEGWIVVRVSGRLEIAALDELRSWLTKTEDHPRILILMDYVERQPEFEAIVENIQSTNETYSFCVRLIGSCRTAHFFAALRSLSAQHEHVPLSPASGDDQVWLRGFQRETVARILARAGLVDDESARALCRDTPVLAVFLAWLRSTGRPADLHELLRENDFGKWLWTRLTQDLSISQREVPTLFALFPMSCDAAGRLPQEKYGRVRDRLAQDGWIEREQIEEDDRFVTVHDVITDRVLLSYVESVAATGDIFVRDLLDLAAGLGLLGSALFSLQRIREHSPLSDWDWLTIIGSRIRDHLAEWIRARIDVLRSDLLSVPQRLRLLKDFPELWVGAESDPFFQNSLGWLIRQADREGLFQSTPDLLQIADDWATRASGHVTSSNFLLTQGLRTGGPSIRDAAKRWIVDRPRLFQTHFLIVAWLRSELPPDEIKEAVCAWCTRNFDDFHFSYVAAAWLDAGGVSPEMSRLCSQWVQSRLNQTTTHYVLRSYLRALGADWDGRDLVERWLSHHEKEPEAGGVLIEWLQVTGDWIFAQRWLRSWSRNNRNSQIARRVYREWLKAGGNKSALEPEILEWLFQNPRHSDALMAGARWLRVGGNPEAIRSIMPSVLDHGGTDIRARFLFEFWLKRGGDKTLLETPLVRWLQVHERHVQTRRVLESWLESGGGRETIRAATFSWLSEFEELLEGRHLIDAWLRYGDDLESIRAAMMLWLNRHGTRFEADLVYTAWLDVGGRAAEISSFVRCWFAQNQRIVGARFLIGKWVENGNNPALAKPAIRDWLSVHGLLPEATFVLCEWLKSVRDSEWVGAETLAWLNKHGSTMDARFVFEAWLEGGGPSEPVRVHALAWLQLHGESREANFVYRPFFAARVRDEQIVQFFRGWLTKWQTDDEADFPLRPWLDGGGDREVVRDSVVAWLAKHGKLDRASFILASWMKAKGDLSLVADHVRTWLSLHSTSPEARFVCTAWLDAKGEFAPTIEPMRHRFRTGATDPGLQFEIRAWLEAGGSKDEIQNLIRDWLASYGTIQEAEYVYTAWLHAEGDRALVRQTLAGWLQKFSESLSASYVLPAWLEATGEFQFARESVVKWLQVFPTHLDASYVLEKWLESGGDFATVQAPARAWLSMHGHEERAGYVLVQWLKSRGAIAEVLPLVLNWLERYGTHQVAMFLVRMVARERKLAARDIQRVLRWATSVPDRAIGLGGLAQLGQHLLSDQLRKEILAACESVITPLLSARQPIDPNCRGDLLIVISFLLSVVRAPNVGNRKQIDDLFVRWTRAENAHALETKRCENVQRIHWLSQFERMLTENRLNVSADKAHIARFLSWLDAWEEWRKRDREFIDAINRMKRRFPEPDLWRRVSVPTGSVDRDRNRFHRR